MESNHTNWYAYECDQQHHAAVSAKIPPYPTNEQRKTVEVNGEEVKKKMRNKCDNSKFAKFTI